MPGSYGVYVCLRAFRRLGMVLVESESKVNLMSGARAASAARLGSKALMASRL